MEVERGLDGFKLDANLNLRKGVSEFEVRDEI